jgi:cytochrome o ubiquinol oxidase subunit III
VSTNSIRYPGLNLGTAHPEVDSEGEELIFGFWVFLMSDAIIFGLLFATYAIMSHSLAGGPGPRQLFDIRSAAIETFVLLLSSFTFGLASLSLKHERSVKPLLFWLCVTVALGLVFLGFEIHDFVGMFAKGGGPTRSGFTSAFFALVPLHGLHVTAGILWTFVVLVQLAIFGRDRQLKLTFLRLGLFWHFLDIVWVVIFSVVYLGGLA